MPIKADGALIQTRRFALLDDGSRLIPHAQHSRPEKRGSFLDRFPQGLARHGPSEKLCPDLGKILTSLHLPVVGANLYSL